MLVIAQRHLDILAGLHGLFLHTEVAYRKFGIGGGCNGEVSIDISNSAGLRAVHSYCCSHDGITVIVNDSTGDRRLRQSHTCHQEQPGRKHRKSF